MEMSSKSPSKETSQKTLTPSFFDSDKSLRLNIQAKSLKDFPLLLVAVKEFNEGLLNLSLVNNLITMLPTPSEKQKIEDLDKSVKELNFDLAEKYTFQLNKIPQVSQKLEIIKSMFRFEEDLPDINFYLDRVRKVISEIKSSQELKTILGFCLKWGNILNAGTAREKAKGFDFQIVLTNFPPDDKKREGLVYIVEKIFEKNPNFGPIQTKFLNAFSWLINIKQDKNEFKAEGLAVYFGEVKKMLDQLTQGNVALKTLDSSYQEKIQERLSADVKKGRELMENYEQVKNELMDLAVYFSALKKAADRKEAKSLNDAELFVYNLKQFVKRFDDIWNKTVANNKTSKKNNKGVAEKKSTKRRIF